MPDTLADDLLYGAKAIAAFIGARPGQVYHMGRCGHPAISHEPGIGLVARKSVLRETFGARHRFSPDAADAAE